MTNSEFKSIDEFDDIATIDQYNVAVKEGLSQEEALKAVNIFSRDNARTPFHWNTEKNAGFTTGEPWLQVNENYKEINAESQVGNADSVFSFYKKLISLRKSEEFKDSIVYGLFEPALENYDNIVAFYRIGESENLMVLANYQSEPQTVELPEAFTKVLINNYDEMQCEGNKIALQGYQVLVLV